jgi:hypothetical protein
VLSTCKFHSTYYIYHFLEISKHDLEIKNIEPIRPFSSKGRWSLFSSSELQESEKPLHSDWFTYM